MRELNVSLPNEIRCANSVTGIARAIEQGASVINMSYGSTEPCYAEYVQLQVATAKGITLVAAAGNELAEGNPLLFPASLPHVITVAAVGNDLKAAYFSSASAAVDLSAPGVGILTATPPQFDDDGPRTATGGHRHELLRPDGRRRGGLGARRQARLPRRPGRAGAARLGARPPGQGLGLGHRLRAAQPPKALSLPAPAVDPHEPNDDMVWINGKATGRVDSPIWRRGGRASCARSSTSTRTPPTSTGSSSPRTRACA